MNKQKRYDQYMYSYPHKSAYYPLSREVIGDVLTRIPRGEEFAVYFHVPFCSSKCGYCNLFSIASMDEELREEYVKAVIRQVEQTGDAVALKDIKVSQIIFGGGTPLTLDIHQFERLFHVLESLFHVSSRECGFDMETSPNETTEEKLSYLLGRGMRRISMGIQSFHPTELWALKRRHGTESCHEALERIMKYRPECVNLDLIYGIPGQTVESFRKSLSEAVSYQPDELFLYPLYVRRGTPLYKVTGADQEIQYEMYQAAVDDLMGEGYTQTSMRRFLKMPPAAGKSCGFEKTLAFGCGGRSYLGNVHVCEPYEVSGKACRSILDNFINKADFFDNMTGYMLNEEEQMRRYVIKNLGYWQGVPKQEFFLRFGLTLKDAFKELWVSLEQDGLIREEEDRILLTPKGMGDSDRILALWISGNVAKGMSRC